MDGDRDQQVEEARLLLDARKELYGETDPATLDAMSVLARALRDAGSHHEAESVLRTSLGIQNRSAEMDEARITRTEFDLAIVLDRLGEADAARPLWEKVLEASDRSDGPESQLSRQSATNLAITLRKLRRYGDEFPLRVRILESTRRSARTRPRGHVSLDGRSGPNASEPGQPRDGVEPVSGGCGRAREKRRGAEDNPLPEMGKCVGTHGSQATEGSVADVRSGRGGSHCRARSR